jgi:ribosome-associated protein
MRCVNHDDDIRTRDGLLLPVGALEWRFDRAGGPGGQHRNKVHTRATVRVDLELLTGSADLVERVRGRLGGALVLSESAARSQWRNRVRVLERVKTTLEDAARPERRRRASRPTRGSVEERLAAKRRNAERKRRRRGVPGDEQ